MDMNKISPEVLLDKALNAACSFSQTEFPISIFPKKIQGIITEVHECQSFPIDYIASSMLVALALGIGNSHLTEFKRGWQESPILYLALVGRPGANKSHPLSFAMKPFIEIDYLHNIEYEKEYERYEAYQSLSKKDRLEEVKEPKRVRLLVSDITPEGLSLIHSQNKRGLCLCSDELSAWFKNFNRYNNGSEEQFWLSVWNAKTTISDRKGAKSSIFIKRPYISVVGTIQQKILRELSKGERSANGFIDCILFVMPELQTKARWSLKELSEHTTESWSNLIKGLVSMQLNTDEYGEPIPQILRFSDEARTHLFAWQDQHARLCDTETNDSLVGIYCKLEVYIIRFALIIQLSRWVCGEADKDLIDLVSVERAIDLTEYFRSTAIAIYSIVNEQSLTKQQELFVEALPSTFQIAEALVLADSFGLKERTLKKFIKENIGKLFIREKHGTYSKIINK